MSRALIVVSLILKIIDCQAYNLSIIHFNDFHDRYEPVDKMSATCEGPHCMGGFSRLYSTIKRLKQSNPDSLVLNAGDSAQGTLWYIVHKWNVTQHFLNKLPLDAITLGNHEFDNGIEGLVPFLQRIQAPVVVSNIDDSLEPRINDLYKKSTVVEKDGRKIGIIGVLTKTTMITSRAGKVIITDESASVNSQAGNLVEAGVFTNIVLSHCGYEADLEIARKSASKISVVVGGHTDNFLYTGTPVPGPDKPSGPYPTVVVNQNGGKVLVVQASAHSKYLGNLGVSYDDFGNVTGWSGAPIFLGPDLPTDPDIDMELEVWKRAVEVQGGRILGETKFTMPNKPCRSEECPLGNFATDAMVYNYAVKTNWTNNVVAMFHAGGMRAGIESGNITFKQLMTTFPFQNTINAALVKGKHIREILESCVDDRHLKWPHLLQVSGLRIIYNTTKPEGQRVQSLETCSSSTDCKDVVSESEYHILLPTFLTDSGFNPLFQKYIQNKVTGDLEDYVYSTFLKVKSPLAQKVEGRIQITK